MKTIFKGIKTAAEHRRGELTKDILRLVGAGVVMGAATVVAPNTLQLIEYFDPKNKHERNKIWKAIKYLEARNKVLFEEQNGNCIVTLTTQGRIQLNDIAIWELTISAPRRWDRKWRLVMFDLPSKSETVRQSFRQKLQDFGFCMYQRSVFIYPHECFEEIQTVAKWYGVQKHVRYIVATEIHDTRTYIKKFDLL